MKWSILYLCSSGYFSSRAEVLGRTSFAFPYSPSNPSLKRIPTCICSTVYKVLSIQCLGSIIFQDPIQISISFSSPHLTDRETEVERGKVTFLAQSVRVQCWDRTHISLLQSQSPFDHTTWPLLMGGGASPDENDSDLAVHSS